MSQHTFSIHTMYIANYFFACLYRVDSPLGPSTLFSPINILLYNGPVKLMRPSEVCVCACIGRWLHVSCMCAPRLLSFCINSIPVYDRTALDLVCAKLHDFYSCSCMVCSPHAHIYAVATSSKEHVHNKS